MTAPVFRGASGLVSMHVSPSLCYVLPNMWWQGVITGADRGNGFGTLSLCGYASAISRPEQKGHRVQTIFSNVFSWMKSLYFDWSLFLNVQLILLKFFFHKGSTISQHWFRKWPGAWINNYSVHWRTLASAEPEALKGLQYNDVNLSRPGDAYMHQQTWSSLVEILVWRLFGAMPLSEPVQALLLIGPLGTFF